MKHEIKKEMKLKEGFVTTCWCGWSSRTRFMPEFAKAEFEDHVTAKTKKKSGVQIIQC